MLSLVETFCKEIKSGLACQTGVTNEGHPISESLVAKVILFCKELEEIKAKFAGITDPSQLELLKSNLESEIHKKTRSCSKVVKKKKLIRGLK